MIKGSEVIDPCPISVAADMMVMVPSVAMLIHGLIAVPARSPERTAALRPAGNAMANDSPAAPIMIWRRDTWRGVLEVSNFPVCLFMSRLPRRALDRANDPLVGAAAADVGAHVLDDLGAGGLRFLLEQIGRAHDLAGLAVSALRHVLGEPGLLHRMARIRRQSFDRGDRLAGQFRELCLARIGALAVDVHHAGAAQSGATAEFCAGE